MGKAKGTNTTWSHHETMILNLKDWIKREINVLRTDLAREAPSLADDPHVSKLLKSAEDMNVSLFDMVASVVERAEKVAKAKPVAKSTEEDDEDFVEA